MVFTTLIIANSLEQFTNILKKLDQTDLEDKEECKKTFEDIKKDIPNTSYEYWEGLIASAYEFLTDEEYWEDA